MISRPTLPTKRRRRARSQGFTLVEMMVVFAIIGLMALAVTPRLSTMMAEHRLQRVALEVMLAARRARVEAMFSGYASALYFTQTAAGAVIVPVTGLTSRCNRGDNEQYIPATGVPQPFNGWQQLVGAPPITLATYDFASSTRARLTFNDNNQTTGFLCWEPRGECWYSTNPWNAAATNPQTVMHFERFDSADAVVGVERQVVFPASCTARLR